MNKHTSVVQIIHRFLSALLCLILLTQCSKSAEPTYYTLTPHHLGANAPKNHHTVRIGIDMVTIPEYLDSPYLRIFTTTNQAQLLELHQWAGAVDVNIGRVIQTNISTYLPNAAIQMAPWDTEFYPDYHLRIDITQFNVDIEGNSILQAIYTIEKNKESVNQYQTTFYEKVAVVTPSHVVVSMNNQLQKLTQHIAARFRIIAK